MRKVVIFIFLIFFVNADVLELIKSVNEVKKSININEQKVGNIYNPFVNFKENKTILKKDIKIKKPEIKKIKKVTNLDLKIIFNNSAKIGVKWYKKGDVVGNMVIIKINPYSVVLKKGEKERILYMKSKNILKVSQ